MNHKNESFSWDHHFHLFTEKRFSCYGKENISGWEDFISYWMGRMQFFLNTWFLVSMSHKTWLMPAKVWLTYVSISVAAAFKNQKYSRFIFQVQMIQKWPLHGQPQQTTDMQQSLWVINYESSPNSLDNHFNLFLSIQNNFKVKLSLLFWQITNYLK